MRTKLILSISLIFSGLVFFIISSSGEFSQPHYQLTEFYEKLNTKEGELSKNSEGSREIAINSTVPKEVMRRSPSPINLKTYMTIYGNVKEGSIQKDGVQASFTIKQKTKELNILFTGKTLLPDTLKDGSEAAVEGIYDSKEKVFVADKVMAKCASRYKSYKKD